MVITQEFYLLNNKFGSNYEKSGQITLLVYQEKDRGKTEYCLKWPANKSLIPERWMSEIRILLTSRPKQQIILRVSYEPENMTSLDADDREIINPIKIEGGWEDARQWLLKNYPYQENCKKVGKLDCSNKMLTGYLDLSSFPKLQEVDCSHNYLTGLNAPESVYKIKARNNNISSLNNITMDWENTEIDLTNNPLNIQEVINLVKNLQKSIGSEQAELAESKRRLEEQKQELNQAKKSLKVIKQNLSDLQKEHQEQIRATQVTINELDKKLTLKEQELIKQKNKTIPNSISAQNWLEKNPKPIMVVVIIVFLLAIYYLFRKIFL